MTPGINTSAKAGGSTDMQRTDANTLTTDKLSLQLQTARATLSQLHRDYRDALLNAPTTATELFDFQESASQPGLALAMQIEQFAPVEIKKSDELFCFDDPHVSFLARTLTQRAKDRVPENTASSGPPSQNRICQLTEREFKTLSNERRDEFSILITPATLIKPDTPINLISARSDRPAWYGLPSLLYAVPHSRGGGTRVNPNKNGPELSRTTASHPLSFASNKAFGETPAQKSAFADFRQQHTPHQSLHKLIENARAQNLFKQAADIHQDVVTHLKTFSDTLGAWVRASNTALDKTVADHNEVAIRLWPWDVSHVIQADVPDVATGDAGELSSNSATAQTVSPDKQTLEDALHSAIVIAGKRHQLASELLASGQGLGTEHPLLLEFLEHQLSADIPDDAPDHKAVLQEKMADCTDEFKQTVALDLASKLIEKVSLVSYTPGEANFKPLRDHERLITEDVYLRCREVTEAWFNTGVKAT